MNIQATVLYLLLLEALGQLLHPRQEVPTTHVWPQDLGDDETLPTPSAMHCADSRQTYVWRLVVLYQAAERALSGAERSVQHVHV
jgi:hypothetical protein